MEKKQQTYNFIFAMSQDLIDVLKFDEDLTR